MSLGRMASPAMEHATSARLWRLRDEADTRSWVLVGSGEMPLLVAHAWNCSSAVFMFSLALSAVAPLTTSVTSSANWTTWAELNDVATSRLYNA